MMFVIQYEAGFQIVTKVGSSWGRVDDANGKVVYEGTYDGAEKWLHDRRTWPLDWGTTREERQAKAAERGY